MKTPELLKLIRACYALREPLFIMGAPGIGKSDVVRQFTYGDNLQMLDCRLVFWDPVDLRGIPVVMNGATHWLTPATFPRDGQGIVFLDELPQAATATQAAASQFTLDRRLGDYVLPEGWSIVAAGNRQSDRAGSNKLQSQLISRFVFAELEVDTEAWVSWALGANINPLVLAFIRWRPELLHKFDPATWDNKSYACPRSWAKASKLLDVLPDASPEILKGIVGEGPAGELHVYRELVSKLPPIESILLDPKGAVTPKKPNEMYAVVSALARHATKGNLDKIFTYLERLPDEYAVLCVKDMGRVKPECCETIAWVEWSVKYAHLFN